MCESATAVVGYINRYIYHDIHTYILMNMYFAMLLEFICVLLKASISIQQLLYAITGDTDVIRYADGLPQ